MMAFGKVKILVCFFISQVKCIGERPEKINNVFCVLRMKPVSYPKIKLGAYFIFFAALGSTENFSLNIRYCMCRPALNFNLLLIAYSLGMGTAKIRNYH
jgi:hypothetical protein